MYYVYILKLNNGKYYSGYTENLKRRLTEHKNNKVSTTANCFVELIWYSSFLSKKKAMDFEIYLKSSSGFAFRNKRLI